MSIVNGWQIGSFVTLFIRAAGADCPAYSDLDHFKIILANTTFRTLKIVGNIFPSSARRDAFIRSPFDFIVNPSTNYALPPFHAGFALVLVRTRPRKLPSILAKINGIWTASARKRPIPISGFVSLPCGDGLLLVFKD
jgi:hypothetical protein